MYLEDSDDEDYDHAEGKKRGGGAKSKRRGGGGGGSGSGAGGAGASVVDPLTARPQVERLFSLIHLKERLPINVDPSTFGCPPGWDETFTDEGRRRPKKKWVRSKPPPAEAKAGEEEEAAAGGVDDDGAGAFAEESIERRWDLEGVLEREAESAGVPYLGHFFKATGEWQISAKALPAALTHVLETLVASGMAREVLPAHAGKAQPHWVVCNTYVKGEPFPKPNRPEGAGGKKEEDDEPEEALADIELERLRNIERNKAILRSLGLA